MFIDIDHDSVKLRCFRLSHHVVHITLGGMGESMGIAGLIQKKFVAGAQRIHIFVPQTSPGS